MTQTPTPPEAELAKPSIARPLLSNWVWRPWYAKMWWALSAVYWTGSVGAFLFEPLNHFYSSNLAGFLNMAFYPVFTFVVLSVGWVIAWKEALDYAAEHPVVENTLGWQWQPYDWYGENERRHSQRNDPSNPASPFYIANENARRMFDR